MESPSGPRKSSSDESWELPQSHIYVAERCEHRPGLVVYSPDGKELAFISTGQELPTNVGFGRGEDRKILYVTSGKSLYRIKIGKDGYQLPPKK